MVNYITPSLINSWLYVTHNENADIQEFIDYLNHIQTPPTEAQQQGLNFEDEVYALNKPLYNPYVEGGLFQVRVSKPYKDILLLGIIDVLQPNWIYDVKTTSRYEVGKYYNTSQHKIYCYITGINNFSYLVNEECYKEDYSYQDGQCEELIDSFLYWLKQTNLYDTWKSKWIKTESEVKELWSDLQM